MRGLQVFGAVVALGLVRVICFAGAPPAGQVPPAGLVPPDEAKLAGKTRAYFYPRPGQVHDYFPGMDAISAPPPGGALSAPPDALLDLQASRAERVLRDPVRTDSERLGRNTWMLWCGGNEAFWDWLSTNSHGFLDLLKVVDSRKRAVRWRDAGLVNEPQMRQATESDCQGDLGLWLDQPTDPKHAAYRQRVIASAFGSARGPSGGVGSPAYPSAPPATAPLPPASAAGPTGGPANAFDEVGYDPSIPPAGAYGLPTGVIGLRLFPNPNFNDRARKAWDAKRYYEDPSYYNDPGLVRPFRVGMSCAFCHANPHPLNPPTDPVNPRWENLSGSIGSQYLRMRAVFGNLLTTSNFIYHVLDSQPPGTIDTSLIASDNINNTNTMNAIFGVPQRAMRSFENPRETLAAPAASLPSLWRDPDRDAPPAFKKALGDKLTQSNGNPRYVPRILFDGADSIGVYGALARVYLNIGTHHQQWVRLHEPLLGFLPPEAATDADRQTGRTQLPFRIEDCQQNSVYWQATQDRVEALRDYFLVVTPTMPLMDALDTAGPAPATRKADPKGEATRPPSPVANPVPPAGAAKPRIEVSKLARGRQVFARNCIVCHSSIQPETEPSWFLDDPATQGAYATAHADVIDRRKRMIRSWEQSGEVWDHDPGQWLRDPKYVRWAAEVVDEPNGGFWRQNYLSTDFRVPVNYVGTNSARAMATNATNGHMWEDFSSDTYRRLPSVGSIAYFDPFRRTDELYTPRHRTSSGAPAGGGGPGFYRPASLMSVWATAPLLHNNSLGHFNNDPSVKGRLAAFDDAIHKLLYPDRRLRDSDYAPAAQLAADHGLIWRTPTETYLQIRGRDVPLFLRRFPLPRDVFTLAEEASGMGRWRAAIPGGLLLAALAILFVARGRRRVVRWWRFGAYGLAVVALLVGFVLYLDTGGFGDLRLGPIPAGTPVNLLANLNPEADEDQLKAAIRTTVDGLTEIQTRRLEEADRDRVFNERIGPALLAVSKCPDFVMDKGHYFPWFADMSDADKEALIELLKTF